MPKEITPETFEKFVQERCYLYNVSPNKETLYRNAWRKWQKYGLETVGFVAGLRQAGTTPTWAEQPPLRKLKEDDKIPPTFTPSDMQKLLRHKPRSNPVEHIS